jgi:hypothetical protein
MLETVYYWRLQYPNLGSSNVKRPLLSETLNAIVIFLVPRLTISPSSSFEMWIKVSFFTVVFYL